MCSTSDSTSKLDSGVHYLKPCGCDLAKYVTWLDLLQPVSGAENLLSIGAVEFLSHLRQDVDPELYQSIDNVIYQLLSLPQDDAQEHEHWCLYKMHKQEGVETFKSSEHQRSLYLTSGRFYTPCKLQYDCL